MYPVKFSPGNKGTENNSYEWINSVLCYLLDLNALYFDFVLVNLNLQLPICSEASFSLLLILLGLILTRCNALCQYPHDSITHWPANSSDWLVLSALSENICNAIHSSYMEH